MAIKADLTSYDVACGTSSDYRREIMNGSFCGIESGLQELPGIFT